jgi:pimeloyl-ACP methyl ester carboxylesterase
MNECPMFIPFGEEHLAAVLSLPETEPRALVLFLQGLGAPRSHRNRVWTRMARDMGERGIASIRFDYPEIGDSTGRLDASSPVDQAVAVVEFAMRVTGVDSFGVVGNGRGMRTALTLASRNRSCTSLGCLLLGYNKLLRGGGHTTAFRAVRNATLKTPRLRRQLRRLASTDRRLPRFRFTPELTQAVRSTDVMLFFLGRDDIGEGLRAALARLGSSTARQLEFRAEPILGTSGFQIPASAQPLVIGAFVDWMDRSLLRADPGANGEPRSSESSFGGRP